MGDERQFWWGKTTVRASIIYIMSASDNQGEINEKNCFVIYNFRFLFGWM